MLYYTYAGLGGVGFGIWLAGKEAGGVSLSHGMATFFLEVDQPIRNTEARLRHVASRAALRLDKLHRW